MAGTFHRDTLRDLGKRRIVIGRGRHRGRKAKTRQAFPGAGRGITTGTAITQVSISGPQRRPPPRAVTICDPSPKPPDAEPATCPGVTAGHVAGLVRRFRAGITDGDGARWRAPLRPADADLGDRGCPW